MTSDPFQSIQEKPSTEHSYTVSGWLKNFGRDVSDFAAAIPAAFKVAALEGYNVAKHWRYLDDILVKNPELLTRELDRTTTQVIKSVTDTYKDGLGEALYKHPFSVLLDATTVFDLLGGGIKAAGKSAARMSAKTAEEAAIRAATSSMVKLGTSIQSMPGRILSAPFKITGNALAKVPLVSKAMTGFGLDPIGREVSRYLGSQMLQERALADPQWKALLRNKLKKVDLDAFDDLVDGVIPRSQVANEKILGRHSDWAKQAIEFERDLLELGIKTTEELEAAVLKQTAIKLKNKGVYKDELWRMEKGEYFVKQEALDFARKWRDGENPWRTPTSPVYKPFTHERSFNIDDLFDALNAGEKSEKYLAHEGRFEKRTGLKSNTLDADVWQARALLQQAHLRAAIKTVQYATQKYGKPLKSMKADKGYRIIDPLLQRYVQGGLVTAQQMLVTKVGEAIAKAEAVGADRAKAVVQAIRETGDDLRTKLPELQADLADALRSPGEWAIQVPEGVASVLQRSLIGPKGIVRAYDNLLDTWRDAMLTFMPRYYVNNLLGNAVLLMFAGHTPFSKATALKRGDLPGEALGSYLAAEGGSQGSMIARIAPSKQKGIRRLAGDLAEITDNQAKQIALTGFAGEVIQKQAELGNLTAIGLSVMDDAGEAAATIMRARREILSLPIDELKASRRALESLQSQGFAQAQRAPLNVVQKSMVDSLTKEIEGIQRRIRTEGALSNIIYYGKGPSRGGNAASGNARITELKAQLDMKVRQLSGVTSTPLTDMFPAGKLAKMPEIQRIAEIQERTAVLKPYADLAEKSVRKMETFFGNYGRLHPMEREYIRRVIPFWTFSKTMFQLLYQLPFIRPKTAFAWNHFAKMMVDAMGDDRLPSRYRNAIPFGGDANGNFFFVRINSFNPLEKAAEWGQVGGVPIPKFIDPVNNPIVKVGVETISGVDTFTQRPLTSPTDFVSLNGTIWRYDPDTGQIKRVLPQKAILDAVFEQVPHMKIVGEILEGMGLTGAGSFFGVHTPRNPDGTVTYNRHWLQGISRAFGFATSVQNPEKVKLQHDLLRRGMIKRFRSAGRRVDPETRAQLEHILQNLGDAEVFE